MPAPAPLPTLVETAVRPILLRLQAALKDRYSWVGVSGHGFSAGGAVAGYHYLEIERPRGSETLIMGVQVVRTEGGGYSITADVVGQDSGRIHFQHPRCIPLPATADDFEVASEARTLASSLSAWVLDRQLR